jgi:glutamine amidotransferase
MQAIIVDYGMGNVASVKKALDIIGIDNVISNHIDDFDNSQFVFLPGVGSFRQGMENLNKLGLVTILNDQIINRKKPFFGICLGMQLIAQIGTEHGETSGLGWIKGKISQLVEENLRVPHLGWNNISSDENSLINEFHNRDFYFIHSYHFEVSDKKNIAAYVNYGHDYVAAVNQENIFATQFHPEKSQDEGIKLLKKFIDSYA